MPFKSKAQAGKMFAMEERGELKPGVAEEFAHATPDMKKLPEHVKKHASPGQPHRHKEHR